MSIVRPLLPTLSALTALAALWPTAQVRADENLFGYVYGAETLPQGHYDFYQTTTARTGKDSGDYLAWDSETEIEYGFTDRFQTTLGIDQHYFDIEGVPGLDDQNRYRFGGASVAAKYRHLSPFKDVVGLAYRLEVGFHRYDEVAGIIERETLVAPSLALQKNFLDDTLITVVNAGCGLTWGKQPAEEYDYELALTGGAGVRAGAGRPVAARQIGRHDQRIAGALGGQLHGGRRVDRLDRLDVGALPERGPPDDAQDDEHQRRQRAQHVGEGLLRPEVGRRWSGRLLHRGVRSLVARA